MDLDPEEDSPVKDWFYDHRHLIGTKWVSLEVSFYI